MTKDDAIQELVRRRDDAEEIKAQAPVAQVLDLAIRLIARIDGRPGGSQPLDSTEVAERLGVCRKTVQNWCADGRFPNAWKTSESGVWRIPASDLHEMLHGDEGAEGE